MEQRVVIKLYSKFGKKHVESLQQRMPKPYTDFPIFFQNLKEERKSLMGKLVVKSKRYAIYSLDFLKFCRTFVPQLKLYCVLSNVYSLLIAYNF